MSRRKQAKPQHIQYNDLCLTGNTASLGSDSPPELEPCDHIFLALSDLETCSNSPVLTVNDDEDLLSASKTFPAASSAGEQMVNNSGKLQDRYSSSSVESPGSISSGTDSNTDLVFCTSAASPRPDCSSDQRGNSWMNVITENLERTRAAMAQFSQQTPSERHHSESAVSSLLQQLLALQIQQIHQLQLIDRIRHQVLLFASHTVEPPENLTICSGDVSSSKSTDQLTSLSSHLSQQLAAAAEAARSLSAQSADLSDSTEVQPSETSQNELLPAAAYQHMHDVSESQLGVMSKTNTSSSMFSNSHFTGEKPDDSQMHSPPPGSELTALNSVPNISVIVEDLDALAALGQQGKCRSLSLSAAALPSKEFFCKCKRRFCSRVFGGNSVNLQSHTRERPYKCNVCGNGFCSRGNLQVHFQRHKDTYPHIQINPYPAPEHIVQTSAGIARSVSTEKTWFKGSQAPTRVLSAVASNLTSVIKEEEQLISAHTPLSHTDLYCDSAANPVKTFDSVETKHGPVTYKTEDVDVLPHLFICSSPTLLPGYFSFKHCEDPKLQLLSQTADKTVSDPNECLICHRTLSCPSALRMHYRTHTGEHPYQCQLCSRAFTTKGNLKTHQAVHCATLPLRVQHSCPICQMKFTSAVALQQHIHMHIGAHLPSADPTYLLDPVEDFRHTPQANHMKNLLDDSGGFFCGKRLSKLKSLSIHLSPSSFGKNLTDANKKTSCHRPQLLNWIKTEKPAGPNEECGSTNTQQAADRDQWTGTFTISDSSALNQFLSSNDRAAFYSKASNLDEPFQAWLSRTTLMLCAPGAVPTDLNFLNHAEDSPHWIHTLREKGMFKTTFCDVCGKKFSCQSALDIHYRSHTKERPFTCTTCDKGFSTKGNLKQHMLTHQMGDNPPRLFEPSSSNHTSSMLSTVSQPVKTTMETFLNCSAGNSKDCFGHLQSLSVTESPQRAAAPPRPRRTPKQHHCKTCGKSFSSSSALQIHERTHTGERPFSCTVCGRAFTTKGNLKVHMGTHMWNSAPSRRGRRLSVDRSSLGFRIRPVKLPEPPQTNPSVVSSSIEPVYHWK